MGDFGWLAVGLEEQPELSVVLMALPGAPLMDEHTDKPLRGLIAKGVAGTLF
jgi:hypothetical protein